MITQWNCFHMAVNLVYNKMRCIGIVKHQKKSKPTRASERKVQRMNDADPY